MRRIVENSGQMIAPPREPYFSLGEADHTTIVELVPPGFARVLTART